MSAPEQPAKDYLAVVYEKGATFSAFLPDLPGCAANGATRAEVLASLKVAAAWHLEAIVAGGRPIPSATTRLYTPASNEAHYTITQTVVTVE